jgi:hypothetical protein
VFQIEFVERIKTHIICLVIFLLKNCSIYEVVEKYGGIRQATGDSIAQCGKVQFACMLSKATTALSEYAIPIAFPWQQWLWKGVAVFHYICISCLVIHVMYILCIIL